MWITWFSSVKNFWVFLKIGFGFSGFGSIKLDVAGFQKESNFNHGI
jgi:hypothetical protein